MNANGLLKWLVPGALLLVLLLLFTPRDGQPPATPAAPDAADRTLSPEQARALGVDGDTPRDTVATLVGQVKAMRSELVGLKQSNQGLQDENRRLRARESGVDSRIHAALSGVTDKATQERRQADEARRKAEADNRQAQSLLQQVQAQLDALTGQGADLPVGLGLQPGDGANFKGGDALDDERLLWIEPADAAPNPAQAHDSAPNAATTDLPGSFKPLQDLGERLRDRAQAPLRVVSQGDAEPRAAALEAERPVYTLPQNATLIGSVAMTALIGRVPVDGTVSDPYPFKVLVGADNLAANGLDLPEVAGAVMSGTATGDWTLSCVRGQVESITFVFTDGTLRTLPPPQKVISRNAAAPTSGSDKLRGGLGYLSDPYGVPCIAGLRRSNARQYLGSQSLITAAGAGVAALFGADQSGGTSLISNGATLGLGDNPGQDALNQILARGVGDIRAWVNTLYGEAFAAVYVPPAAQVALHLDQQLTLDYAPSGRRLRHEYAPLQTSDLD